MRYPSWDGVAVKGRPNYAAIKMPAPRLYISSGPSSGYREQKCAQSKGLQIVQPAALSCSAISSITRARVMGLTSRPPND